MPVGTIDSFVHSQAGDVAASPPTSRAVKGTDPGVGNAVGYADGVKVPDGVNFANSFRTTGCRFRKNSSRTTMALATASRMRLIRAPRSDRDADQNAPPWKRDKSICPLLSTISTLETIVLLGPTTSRV